MLRAGPDLKARSFMCELARISRALRFVAPTSLVAINTVHSKTVRREIVHYVVPSFPHAS
jgi:hypothetical protein